MEESQASVTNPWSYEIVGEHWSINDYIMRRYIASTIHKILYEIWNDEIRSVRKMHWESNCAQIFLRNLNRMTQFGECRHRRVENIKTGIQETGWRTWIGLIWLRTGTCGMLLQTWWTFGFDKMCRLSVSKQTTTFSRRNLVHGVKLSVSELATYH
jgi:hypothetical protein